MLLATNYGISWGTFPKQGAPLPDQVAAQLDICNIVTSEMDSVADAILRANIDTEEDFGPNFIITVDSNTGWVRYRFPVTPILWVVNAQYCPAGNVTPTWTSIPVSQITTQHTAMTPTGSIVPTTPTGPTSILLPPGYVDWSAGRNGFRVQVSAMAGFPVAGIDVPAAAGTNTLHVDDITGWYNSTLGGARGTIYDPPLRESVTVAGVTPDTPNAVSGPGTLTLTANLQFTHTPIVGQSNVADQKILLSAMPNSLIQAAMYFATHFGLIRGATASVMQTARGQVVTTGMAGAQDWYTRAEKSVNRWGRNVL